MSSIVDNSNKQVYGGQVQIHMFHGAQAIQKATGISASDTARTVFKYAGTRDDVAIACALGFLENLEMCEEGIKVLHNRSAGRKVGSCLDNSFAEWKNTGNHMACGYMNRGTGVHNMMTFHFFNIDAEGNAYETEERPPEMPKKAAMIRIKATHEECLEFFVNCAPGGRYGGDSPAYICGSAVYDFQAFYNPETRITLFTQQQFGSRRKGVNNMTYNGSYDLNTGEFNPA